mmetsp:Transcript_7707/g.32475  ORF Transcript_7707/g.32475 Transcript_7707/m.32475 type:complete len:273 (+) Transcript_7707:751-1569(+)
MDTLERWPRSWPSASVRLALRSARPSGTRHSLTVASSRPVASRSSWKGLQSRSSCCEPHSIRPGAAGSLRGLSSSKTPTWPLPPVQGTAKKRAEHLITSVSVANELSARTLVKKALLFENLPAMWRYLDERTMFSLGSTTSAAASAASASAAAAAASSAACACAASSAAAKPPAASAAAMRSGSSETVRGAAFLPPNHSAAERAGSGPAVSGKRSAAKVRLDLRGTVKETGTTALAVSLSRRATSHDMVSRASLGSSAAPLVGCSCTKVERS